MAETEMEVISERGRHTRDYPNFFRAYGGRVNSNPWKKGISEEGIVDLGRAENKLCEDLWLERLSRADVNEVPSYSLYYVDYSGTLSFRTVVANFLTKNLKAAEPLLPENILMTHGAGSALDMLAHVLADSGECFMTPAPLYTRMMTDFGERSRLRMLPVQLSSKTLPGEKTGFQLTVDKLKARYCSAQKEGLRVRGILLMNPHNPLGDIYSPQLVRDILEFAKGERLHVIIDEVFAMSVFDKKAKFESFLSFRDLPDPKRTHFVWSFSKDFNLNGMRCGVVHSLSRDVIQAITPLMYFASVSPVVQHKLEIILKDTDWLHNCFFPTNISRMAATFRDVTGRLNKLHIPVHPSEAGNFVFADFSKYLREKTRAAEIELFEQFLQAGVYIIPGQALFYEEPGWFRIIFTHSKPTLDEAFRRIETVLKTIDLS